MKGVEGRVERVEGEDREEVGGGGGGGEGGEGGGWRERMKGVEGRVEVTQVCQHSYTNMSNSLGSRQWWYRWPSQSCQHSCVACGRTMKKTYIA